MMFHKVGVDITEFGWEFGTFTFNVLILGLVPCMYVCIWGDLGKKAAEIQRLR